MAYEIEDPYETGTMPTGDGHEIYWELYGNPTGKPAVVLHGGPGSGATPYWRQFFDPQLYRVLLFDQRGCGRSRPNACENLAALHHNTTTDLIRDIEALRRLHHVDRWLVLGASWGSTLGLSYAVTHPSRVSELVLWAVVLTRSSDVHWLTHTMGEIYPEEFQELLSALPSYPEDGNIALAVNRLLADEDPAVVDAAAAAWGAWENRIATLDGPVVASWRSQDERQRRGFARIVTHYFGHHAFQADEAITGRLERIRDTPTFLLRGRLDISSPLSGAHAVVKGLANATLQVVEGEGHAAGPQTLERLVGILDELAAPGRDAVME